MIRFGKNAVLAASGSAGILFASGCFILLSLLAHRFPLRLDLSSGRVYSLSPGSKRILRTLDGPIEARVYFSKDLPPEYASVRSYLGDILKEYEKASRGVLRARFIDIDKEESAKSEALSSGIAPLQLNVVSKERFEVREGMMGLILQKESKTEVLPVIASTQGLEYDLSSRIRSLSRNAPPTLGIVSSHGAIGPANLLQSLSDSLRRSYTVVPVDLAALKKGGTIQEPVDALLLLGPQQELGEIALQALDRHLISGKPLVAAIDARRSDLRSFMASPGPRAVREQLRGYGIGVGSSYVLDRQNQPVQISQNRGFFTFTNVVPFPLFVVSDDLNADHPVTRHLESLSLPFPAALEISTSAAGPVVLARSSDQSWQRTDWSRGFVHSVNPLQNFTQSKEDPTGPFVLAAALSGPFQSAFSGASSAPGARLLVVGTGRLASPEMPTGASAAAFLLNAADWACLDEDLIAVRSKAAAHRPLQEISPSAKTAVKWGNILLPPLFVAFFGLLRLRRRRLAHARSKQLYSTFASA